MMYFQRRSWALRHLLKDEQLLETGEGELFNVSLDLLSVRALAHAGLTSCSGWLTLHAGGSSAATGGLG